jgi:hypothetical protein
VIGEISAENDDQDMKMPKQIIGQSPRNSEGLIEYLSLSICHLQLRGRRTKVFAPSSLSPHAGREPERGVPEICPASQMQPAAQLQMTNFQWPILNCIFLLSLKINP